MSEERIYVVYVAGTQNGSYTGKEYQITHSDPMKAEDIGKNQARKEGFTVEHATVEVRQ
jgi:hypothetical protein